MNGIQWFVQIAGGIFIIFMMIGGGFARREALADGGVRTTILTLYSSLPPAPKGPAYCSILDYENHGLVLPCNYKPPFIGWLQGGTY